MRRQHERSRNHTGKTAEPVTLAPGLYASGQVRGASTNGHTTTLARLQSPSHPQFPLQWVRLLVLRVPRLGSPRRPHPALLVWYLSRFCPIALPERSRMRFASPTIVSWPSWVDCSALRRTPSTSFSSQHGHGRGTRTLATLASCAWDGSTPLSV